MTGTNGERTMAITPAGRLSHRLVVALALVVSATLAPISALAISPSLGGISPRGIQRGTETEVTLSGARLGDVKELLLYSPGLQVTKLQAVGENQVKATLKVAPDCVLGEKTLRLRTATGVTEMRTLWVGALPTVEEKEPNSDFTAPQKIPLNVTVTGVVTSEDVDYYAVDLKKGQRLAVEVEGMRLGGTFFDPYVAILDSKRFEMAVSDDNPSIGQDAMTSIVAPADGTYIVQVRETSYGGNGGCAYRLHVGSFPRPTSLVPAGGRPGEEVDVTFIGDAAGPFVRRIKVPADAGVSYRLHAEDAGGISPSGLAFRVIDLPNAIEKEPNDTPDTATPATGALAFNGVINKVGDVDCFKFAGKKGQVFDVHCYARRIGSPLDPIMTLAVAGGNPFATNDDSGGPDSYFRVTLPDDKEYVLTISDHLKKGGANYHYRVEMTAVSPKTTLSIPRVAQNSQERQPWVVHRGNRMASLVTVTRNGWGGEAVFAANGLPAGMSIVAEPVPANLDVVPVVFEAAPQAAIAGNLASLEVKPVDPKFADVKSGFSQVADLIVGNPGQSIYWKTEVSKLACVVADEVPFKISVVQPKAPIVQNGSMQLKVVVERKEGFTAPVTVYSLFNPPGLNTQSSSTIPEKGMETTLTMNAAPNAQTKKWKTAVLASAAVNGGPAWVSSQLFEIEVAAPYFAFAMERAAVEQGKETEIPCKITMNTPIPSNAKVKLMGLPTKVTAPELELTKETKELLFKLQVDPASPAGQHRNIFCQAVVTVNGEPVVHNVGTTELRIDKPLPVKVATVAPTPMPMSKPAAQPAQPMEKRLTRLEKLRLEQAEREKNMNK
ncbi:MAG: pre-peptidase C-terminal domain-containing protein [Planctomycetes bacterium]|nr:pre-peptidase C-terminal domain-containing protein [Planctomycetota bacterium]